MGWQSIAGLLPATGAHLYTWVKRGTVKLNFLAQQLNTTTPTWLRTRTTRLRAQHSKMRLTRLPHTRIWIYFCSLQTQLTLLSLYRSVGNISIQIYFLCGPTYRYRPPLALQVNTEGCKDKTSKDPTRLNIPGAITKTCCT